MKTQEKYATWCLLLGLFISGLSYWYYKKWFVTEDPFAITGHPMQTVSIKFHLVLAPLYVALFGWIAKGHIWPRYRSLQKKGRKTGILNALLFIVCILTGYYLQLLVSQTWSNFVAWVHVGSGVVIVIFLLWHQRVTT
ncbi:MAG: hypothetical protein R3A45_11840 [Bdellovibrionota bacterium]|nr:hypothetical protein [Deltaproteobacteria bacterium]